MRNISSTQTIEAVKKFSKSLEDSGLSESAKKYICETYIAYLESSSRRDKLTETYYHKGERSVEESAKFVGLNLPNSKGN